MHVDMHRMKKAVAKTNDASTHWVTVIDDRNNCVTFFVGSFAAADDLAEAFNTCIAATAASDALAARYAMEVIE